MYKIVGRISKKGDELTMTTADKLKEEGIQKERKRLVKNLFVMGDSVAKIAMVTGLTEKEIEEIKREMVN